MEWFLRETKNWQQFGKDSNTWKFDKFQFLTKDSNPVERRVSISLVGWIMVLPLTLPTQWGRFRPQNTFEVKFFFNWIEILVDSFFFISTMFWKSYIPTQMGSFLKIKQRIYYCSRIVFFWKCFFENQTSYSELNLIEFYLKYINNG